MTISERALTLQKIITDTAKYYNRDPNDILLLAASKGHSVKEIQQAYNAGLRNFGENHLQEALPKINALHQLGICWHFIGPIQSNKTKGIAQNFSWVHSLDRQEIAHLLEQHRPSHLPPLNICLQVNLDNEKTKSGAGIAQIAELATAICQRPKLRLRGLMAIPQIEYDEEQQYRSFLRLTTLFNRLNKTMKLSMDTLSMGMSQDLIAAIRAGSTIVRIGRGLFGERQGNNK